MIGDGKRKRAAKRQTTAKPDAELVLAEAERQLEVAREHLAKLRHEARTAHSEMEGHLAEAKAELRRAGLELRAPRGPDEMQLAAGRSEWQVHALEAQITGAERAVSAAEGGVAAALLAVYPQRAVALDSAAEELLERRERADAELAAVERAEREHRSAWRRIFSVIPGFGAAIFIPREMVDTRFSPGTDIPQSLTPTFRPERGEGFSEPNLEAQPGWPDWLRTAVERMQQHSTNLPAAAMVMTEAVMEDAPDPSGDDRAFADMIQRARAADRDADANQIRL